MATTASSPPPRMPVAASSHTITARDGFQLAATVYTPQQGSGRAVVVAPATGVKRGLYEPYARFLAARGFTVLTFDFRGIGGSLHGPVWLSDASIVAWGNEDYPAVVDWAAREYGGKVSIVGHSIGGQLVGVLDNVDKIAAVCTVAAQNAYFRRYPPRRALKYGLLWYVAVPVCVGVLRHFPAKRLKLGEDLPRGVALDWARFARHPDYIVDRDGRPMTRGFDALEAPVLAYSFTDDHRAPAANVRALHDRYRRAPVELRDVDPASVGVRAIGHVGFFSSALRKTLWTESLEFLRSALQPVSREGDGLGG